MITRAQQKHHAIQVSYGRQQRQTSLFNAGRYRLHGWGSAIRSIVASLGPPRKPASSRAFTDGDRPDRDNYYLSILNAQKNTKAYETDQWLQPIKESNPNAFEATAIRYIMLGPGGRPLSREEQILMFFKRTSLSKSTYYRYLDRVLQFICAEILTKENKR